LLLLLLLLLALVLLALPDGSAGSTYEDGTAGHSMMRDKTAEARL
jgi:hypothetical protein